MPGRMAPELISRKSWNKDRMMTMNQWLKIKQRIQENVEEFGWQHCHKAAADLNLDVEQVPTLLTTDL
jgi:hypothetical protein